MDKNRRSSDTQIILMQEKLDYHIDEFKKHCDDEEKRWEHLIQAQEQNTKSIKELTDSTRDLVNVWQAANGTVKTLSALGSFVKWVSSFAFIGVFITWLVGKFPT